MKNADEDSFDTGQDQRPRYRRPCVQRQARYWCYSWPRCFSGYAEPQPSGPQSWRKLHLRGLDGCGIMPRANLKHPRVKRGGWNRHIVNVPVVDVLTCERNAVGQLGLEAGSLLMYSTSVQEWRASSIRGQVSIEARQNTDIDWIFPLQNKNHCPHERFCSLRRRALSH
jgi:hypothetical protein